jgi:hypothetical protein
MNTFDYLFKDKNNAAKSTQNFTSITKNEENKEIKEEDDTSKTSIKVTNPIETKIEEKIETIDLNQKSNKNESP